MSKNQKKSGVKVLLIVVAVLLIGAGVWWFVAPRGNKDSQEVADTEQAENQSNQEPAEEPKKIDTSIHEVDITLQTKADLDRLPDYAPESFRSYMAEKLRDNKSANSSDDVATTLRWRIEEISQVNIVGGQFPVNEAGETLPGGAPVIWVLTPSDSWDQEGRDATLCVSRNGGKIYEEFHQECGDANQNWVKNPNGSIKSIND